MPDITRVNDTIYSWNSCLHKFDNVPWVGLMEVNWEQKIETKLVYAARRDGVPLGSPVGKYSVDGFTIKMLRDTANAFTDYLCTKVGKRQYGRARFNYMLQVSEPIPGTAPITASMETCRVVGEKDAHAEGIDELVTEFAILCRSMTKNGKSLWSNEQ